MTEHDGEMSDKLASIDRQGATAAPGKVDDVDALFRSDKNITSLEIILADDLGEAVPPYFFPRLEGVERAQQLRPLSEKGFGQMVAEGVERTQLVLEFEIHETA